MSCSKVFGYQHFSDFLLERSPKPNLNFIGRNRTIKGVSRLADSTIKRENINLANISVFYSTEQTSYLQHAFLALKANRSSEHYKNCTLHTSCRYTRFEHFVCDLANAVLETTKDISKDFSWLSEHFVQRFYNECLPFEDFMTAVKVFYDFESNNSPNAHILSWETYYREHDGIILSLPISLEHNRYFLSQLFSIFVNLDRNKVCETSPFLIKHFLLWWLTESGVSCDKVLSALDTWYSYPATENTPIDFIEFLQIVYRILFLHLDKSVRIILLKDAHDCIVKKIIRKGLLAKAGPNMKGFKVRWMILYPDKILYFKRTSEEIMDYKGIIVLGSCSSVHEVHDEDKKRNYLFSVYCADSRRKFMLRADDQRIRISWVSSIQKVIAVLKGSKESNVFQKELLLKECEYAVLGLNSYEFAIESTSDSNRRSSKSDSNEYNALDSIAYSSRDSFSSMLGMHPNFPNPNPTPLLRSKQLTLKITDIDSVGPDRTSGGLKFRQSSLLLSSDSEDDEPSSYNFLMTKSITLPDIHECNSQAFVVNGDPPPIPARANAGLALSQFSSRASTHVPFQRADILSQNQLDMNLSAQLPELPKRKELPRVPTIPFRQTPLLKPPIRTSSLQKHS